MLKSKVVVFEVAALDDSQWSCVECGSGALVCLCSTKGEKEKERERERERESSSHGHQLLLSITEFYLDWLHSLSQSVCRGGCTLQASLGSACISPK